MNSTKGRFGTTTSSLGSNYLTSSLRSTYPSSSSSSSAYLNFTGRKSVSAVRSSWFRSTVYGCVFIGYSILLILFGFTINKHSSTNKTYTTAVMNNGPLTETTKVSGTVVTSTDPSSSSSSSSSIFGLLNDMLQIKVSGSSSPDVSSASSSVTTNIPSFSKDGSFQLPVNSNKPKDSSNEAKPIIIHPQAPVPIDPNGRKRFYPREHFETVPDADLLNTAIVTMATGDESGRHAVALVQSIRDTNTRIPNIVVLLFRGGAGSADCQDSAKRKAKKRDHIVCESLDTQADEIVSQVYLDALTKLGAIYVVLDPIPLTPYTERIPGGSKIAWGMALNKLRVFALVQFRKVIWIDSDTLVLNNIDHLVQTEDFTAAFTNDCCNKNADAKMSGGFWVFSPSAARMQQILDLLAGPVPGTQNDGWLFGDMQVVQYLFGKIAEPSFRKEWPFSRDLRQGTVPGLRVLPAYMNKTDEELEIELLQGGRRGTTLYDPGILPNELALAQAEGKTVWHMLDPRYDGLVGNCECISERDLREKYFSIHFTCLPVVPPVHKPGRYTNEAEFLHHVRERMYSCMRYYFLRWYDAFARAMGNRLPEPYYDGPEVRITDKEADEIVAKNRKDAYDAAVAAEKVRNAARDAAAAAAAAEKKE